MCLNFPSEKSTHVMQSCQNSLAIWCAVIQGHLYKTTLSKKVLHVMFVHRFLARTCACYKLTYMDGSVAECWTQAQKGPGSNCSRDTVG